MVYAIWQYKWKKLKKWLNNLIMKSDCDKVSSVTKTKSIIEFFKSLMVLHLIIATLSLAFLCMNYFHEWTQKQVILNEIPSIYVITQII